MTLSCRTSAFVRNKIIFKAFLLWVDHRNSARHIFYVFESLDIEEEASPGAALTVAAVHENLAVFVFGEFTNSVGQLVDINIDCILEMTEGLRCLRYH